MKSYIIVLLSLLFCCRVSDTWAQESRWCLTVTDSLSAPLYGVYVVHARSGLLVGTTSDDGKCWISPGNFTSKDSLEFACLGFYSERIPIESLCDGQVIILRNKSFLLDDVYVNRIHPFDLLKRISKGIEKKREKVKGFRYHGNGQYEKITECNGKAIEYRREYGCFATVGNAKKRGTFDRGGEYGFIPRYTARSYPLTPDGADTLSCLYDHQGKLYYESGVRRIFEFMRIVELYGPLFGGIKNYDFKLIESEGSDYTFQFETKKSYYPNKTQLYCQGTLEIDQRTCKLKSIHFDYIEYARCHQPRWRKKLFKEIAFASRADLEFKYGAEGDYYIKSCVMETTWKELEKRGVYGTYPSRKEPEKNRLVEKEAFDCELYKEVPLQGRFGAFIYAMRIGAYNPKGEYAPQTFSRLPELLDSKQAFQDLSQYMDVHEQFQKMSNRSYYPDEYMLHSPWSLDKSMTSGEGVLANFDKFREMLLLCFFTGWRNAGRE